MPFHLRVPLPGPLIYSRRLGRQGPRRPFDPQAWVIGLVIVLLGVGVWALDWWLVPILILVIGLPVAGLIHRNRQR